MLDIKQRINDKPLFCFEHASHKCIQCKSILSKKELVESLYTCVYCGYHFMVPFAEKFRIYIDEGSFSEWFASYAPTDALNFNDLQSYQDRLQVSQTKTKRNDSVTCGKATMYSVAVVVCFFDFQFMGGSLGSVAGEKITAAIERGVEKNLPVVIFSASGGARMQESIYSLMQMAKVTAALHKLSESKLPYISVITHPTTGGVTASFASIGDVIIGEPNALYAFTGPKVIEKTIGAKVPLGSQNVESALKNGFLDSIVERKNIRRTISELLKLFMRGDE